MTHEAPAQIGSSHRAEVRDVSPQLSGGTKSNMGAVMSHEPWWAFIDGPRDQDGQRIHFSSRGAAVVWIAITFVIGSGLTALVIAFPFLLGTNAAALGSTIVLVVCVGPIVVGAYIACINTVRDLISILDGR
jgi:hypothetical protein